MHARTGFLLFSVFLFLAGCVPDRDIASLGLQGKVRVNEVMADNESTITDPDFQEYGDWIEIHNADAAPVQLDGCFLTDDPAEPSKWALPGGTGIPAGGFLLVWADDHDTGLHTSFKLSDAGEGLALYEPSLVLVDRLDIGVQEADVSYGRLPDGAESVAFFHTPTPARPNQADPAPPPKLAVNEIMADNGDTIVDPDFGKHADWIELINFGIESLDLGGFFLSDDPADPRKWAIPAGTSLGGNAFLLIWADEEDQGLHTNFKLGKSGETVAVFDPRGEAVDQIDFGAQETDVSYGRFPDATGVLQFFRTPSPGAPNQADPAPITVALNEFMADNESTLADPDFGAYADWVELYNWGSDDVDLGGFTLTDDLLEPAKWALPQGTVLAGHGFLLVWADGEDQGLHTNFKLKADESEALGLFDTGGEAVDTLASYPVPLEKDQAYGRSPDGEGGWGLQTAATPLAANAGTAP